MHSICVAQTCQLSADPEGLKTQRSEPLFLFPPTVVVLECVVQTAGMSCGVETRGVPHLQALAKTDAKPQITSQILVSGDRPSFCPHSHTKEPERLQNEACFKYIQHTQGFLLKQMF